MNVGKYISNYLKADFVESPIKSKIAAVEVEEIGQEKEQKLVVFLEGVEQGFIPCKTVLKVLSQELGSETSAWIGKAIEVYSDPNVYFQGNRINGLRVRFPA